MLCFKIFKKVQRKEDLCTSAWASKPAFVEKIIQVVTNHIGHRCACKTLHSARTKIQFQYSREHKKHRRAAWPAWHNCLRLFLSRHAFDIGLPSYKYQGWSCLNVWYTSLFVCRTGVQFMVTTLLFELMLAQLDGDHLWGDQAHPWVSGFDNSRPAHPGSVLAGSKFYHPDVQLCTCVPCAFTYSWCVHDLSMMNSCTPVSMTWEPHHNIHLGRDNERCAWDCLRLLENVGLRKWGGNAVGKLRGSLSISILYNDVMYSRRSLWSLGISSGKSLRIVFALTSILEAFAFAVQILTLLNMYTGVHVHAVLRFKQIQTLNL